MEKVLIWVILAHFATGNESKLKIMLIFCSLIKHQYSVNNRIFGMSGSVCTLNHNDVMFVCWCRFL